jgi:cell wall-associated NlpC family hydrolase
MKYIPFYLLLLLAGFVIVLTPEAKANRSHVTSDLIDSLCTKEDSVVSYAYKFLGKGYKYGSSGSGGFDCSGFACHVFKKFGITLPHASYLMAEKGEAIDLDEAQKGDLIFFKGSDANSERVGHVGIIISEPNEPVRFIHSSVSQGVVIDNLSSTYYKVRYVKVKRIL